MLRKLILSILIASFTFTQTGFSQTVDFSQQFSSMLTHNAQSTTRDAAFRPIHLRYFSYDTKADNFQLLLDKGDAKDLKGKELEANTKTLLDYFLVGLSLPNEKFWVNLRPDAQDQIIDSELEKTDIGKIMLEADLQLKKDTAAFTSPGTSEGKEYWTKLYSKANELYGSEVATIPTVTRPWIVPGEVIIREDDTSAYIYKANLKVMLEQDHLKNSSVYNFTDQRQKELNEYSSELIRELIIPKLTKELNTAKRYAQLRQVFFSLVLSRWFKDRFQGKQGAYSKRIDTHNLTNLTSEQAWSKSNYFSEYKKSFQEGEYNLKEQVATPYGQVVRSYVSGGENLEKIKYDAVVASPLITNKFIKGLKKAGNFIRLGVESIIKRLNEQPYLLLGDEYNDSLPQVFLNLHNETIKNLKDTMAVIVKKNWENEIKMIWNKTPELKETIEIKNILPDIITEPKDKIDTTKAGWQKVVVEKCIVEIKEIKDGILSFVDKPKREGNSLLTHSKVNSTMLFIKFSPRFSDPNKKDTVKIEISNAADVTIRELKKLVSMQEQGEDPTHSASPILDFKAVKGEALEILTELKNALKLTPDVEQVWLNKLKAYDIYSLLKTTANKIIELRATQIGKYHDNNIKVFDTAKEKFTSLLNKFFSQVLGEIGTLIGDVLTSDKSYRLISKEDFADLHNQLYEAQSYFYKSKKPFDVFSRINYGLAKIIHLSATYSELNSPEDLPSLLVDKITQLPVKQYDLLKYMLLIDNFEEDKQTVASPITGENTIERADSSIKPSINPGGIDWKKIDYTVKRTGSLEDLDIASSGLTEEEFKRFDEAKEYLSLEEKIDRGYLPANDLLERYSGYVSGCYKRGKIITQDLHALVAKYYLLREKVDPISESPIAVKKLTILAEYFPSM